MLQEVIILFAPLGSSALEFRPLQRALAARGYVSVSFDPGCSGLSSNSEKHRLLSAFCFSNSHATGAATPHETVEDVIAGMKSRGVVQSTDTPLVTVGCGDGALLAALCAEEVEQVIASVYASPSGTMERTMAAGQDGRHEQEVQGESQLCYAAHLLSNLMNYSSHSTPLP